MESEDLVEDSSLRMYSTIIERKLIFNEKTKKTIFSNPKVKKYRRHFESKDLAILKELFSSKDLTTEFKTEVPPCVKEVDSGVDSPSSSGASHSNSSKQQNPQMGEIYLVQSEPNVWVKAKLKKIEEGDLHFANLRSWKLLKANLDSVAVVKTTEDMLQLGTRVVAYIWNITKNENAAYRRRYYQLGTVAELPSLNNKNRYLIIGDNATWSYVSLKSIHPLCCQDDANFEKIPVPHVKRMVMEYFNGVYQPLIEYKRGDVIQLIKSNKCSQATVINVDSSVFTIWLDSEVLGLQFYRGLPFFKKL